MRNAILAMMALLAAGTATIAASSPAAAFDYPYCLQGRGVGIPGDCSYTSYGQCMASASGRALYCNINPRVAFGQQRRGRYIGITETTPDYRHDPGRRRLVPRRDDAGRFVSVAHDRQEDPLALRPAGLLADRAQR